jgi:hypothetical protein
LLSNEIGDEQYLYGIDREIQKKLKIKVCMGLIGDWGIGISDQI